MTVEEYIQSLEEARKEGYERERKAFEHKRHLLSEEDIKLAEEIAKKCLSKRT